MVYSQGFPFLDLLSRTTPEFPWGEPGAQEAQWRLPDGALYQQALMNSGWIRQVPFPTPSSVQHCPPSRGRGFVPSFQSSQSAGIAILLVLLLWAESKGLCFASPAQSRAVLTPQGQITQVTLAQSISSP